MYINQRRSPVEAEEISGGVDSFVVDGATSISSPLAAVLRTASIVVETLLLVIVTSIGMRVASLASSPIRSHSIQNGEATDGRLAE